MHPMCGVWFSWGLDDAGPAGPDNRRGEPCAVKCEVRHTITILDLRHATRKGYVLTSLERSHVFAGTEVLWRLSDPETEQHRSMLLS